MRDFLGALVTATILISTACGGGGEAGSAATATADTGAARAAAPPSGTSQPASTAPQATPASAATAAPAASAPTVRVGVGRTAQYGPFLTDGNGRALYLLEEDGRGQSTCYEMCAVIWPPLLAGQSAPVSADPSVQTNLLGSIPRRGGGAQATYNGHPLYYYLGDSGPGQTRGQHVEDSWGEWYLVSPTGRHVGEDGDDRGGRRRRGGRGGGDR